MKIPFTKLHGAKNDFLVTDAADVPIITLPELAIAICNRYTGIGADGWMLPFDRTEVPGMTPPSASSTPMAASPKSAATAHGASRCCLPGMAGRIGSAFERGRASKNCGWFRGYISLR